MKLKIEYAAFTATSICIVGMYALVIEGLASIFMSASAPLQKALLLCFVATPLAVTLGVLPKRRMPGYIDVTPVSALFKVTLPLLATAMIFIVTATSITLLLTYNPSHTLFTKACLWAALTINLCMFLRNLTLLMLNVREYIHIKAWERRKACAA